MKFIPFDRFVLFSHLEKQELISRLDKIIAKPKIIMLSRPTESYVGEASEIGFKITPVIRYRNSFIPVILGAFEQHHDGIRIKIFQRPHLFVLAFMAFWVFGVVSAGVLFILSPEAEIPEKLIPVIMVLFAWILTTGGFWWEARHTKDELIRILDANEDQSL